MRLSEAMRRGSMEMKQISALFNNGNGGGCALGMAWQGIKGKFEGCRGLTGLIPLGYESGQDPLTAKFPVLNKTVACPSCGYTSVARDVIPHMNNTGFLCGDIPIEKIINWVETVLEKPAEITERENGQPPAIPAKEVMAFIGNPKVEAYIREGVESLRG